MRILVVEDETKVARALREGLEREKYDVVVAPTGEEGFFLVKAQQFDLVILDLMLPAGMVLMCCPQFENVDWTHPFSYSLGSCVRCDSFTKPAT